MTKSKMSLELPKKYSKEQWERGGSRPEHEKFIGMPVTSWSQVESWTAKKGFDYNLLFHGNTKCAFERKSYTGNEMIITEAAMDLAQRNGVLKQLNQNILKLLNYV